MEFVWHRQRYWVCVKRMMSLCQVYAATRPSYGDMIAVKEFRNIGGQGARAGESQGLRTRVTLGWHIMAFVHGGLSWARCRMEGDITKQKLRIVAEEVCLTLDT